MNGEEEIWPARRMRKCPMHPGHVKQFDRLLLLRVAELAGILLLNAKSFATASHKGKPSARMVLLLKEVDARGASFSPTTRVARPNESGLKNGLSLSYSYSTP